MTRYSCGLWYSNRVITHCAFSFASRRILTSVLLAAIVLGPSAAVALDYGSSQVFRPTDYDAFGTLIDSTGTTDNSFLYCGERWDANLGFYYLRARYMNPDSGRFMTMDTWEGIRWDPRSLHKYTCAHVSPSNFIDPSGRQTFTVLETNTVSGIMVLLSAVFLMAVVQNPIFRAAAARAMEQLVNDVGEMISSGVEETGQILAVAMANAVAFGEAVAEAIRKALRSGARNLKSLLKLPVFWVIRSVMPAIFAFNVRCLAVNPSWFVLVYNGPKSRVTRRNRAAVMGRPSTILLRARYPFLSVDEFPFASTVQGGAGAQVEMVPWMQNCIQGGYLAWFYMWRMKSRPGPFLVVPVPI